MHSPASLCRASPSALRRSGEGLLHQTPHSLRPRQFLILIRYPHRVAPLSWIRLPGWRYSASGSRLSAVPSKLKVAGSIPAGVVRKNPYRLQRYTKIEWRFGRERKMIKAGVAGLFGEAGVPQKVPRCPWLKRRQISKLAIHPKMGFGVRIPVFHAQPSRRMTARPMTQSLSSSDINGSSSVKWVMRCW
jgi:hypothetical protein